MPIVRKPIEESETVDFTLIPKELFIDPRLDISSKSVYGVIAMLDQKGEELTLDRISQVAQIPRHKVKASLHKLAEAEWISGVIDDH